MFRTGPDVTCAARVSANAGRGGRPGKNGASVPAAGSTDVSSRRNWTDGLYGIGVKKPRS